MARRRPGPSRRAHGPRFTLGILVLVSITLITLDYRGDLRGTISGVRHAAHDAFAPLESGVDDVVRPIGSFLQGAVHYGALAQQNAKLRSALDQARGEASSTVDLHRRLDELGQLEHVPWADVASIPTVTAQVTAQNVSDFTDTIQLDRGSRAGVDVGMPVVGGAGLVGRVIDVWDSGCTVQLLTDTNSAVSVDYGPQGAEGLVTGRGPGRDLAVDYIDPTVVLQKGTVLTTSGLQGDLFPPGIPVATITAFSSSASATQQSVSAVPLQPLGQLQYVDVLQWLPPPVPSAAGT